MTTPPAPVGPSASEGDVDVDVTLRRVVVGYRVVGVVWLLLLAVVAFATDDVDVVVVLVTGFTATAWTAVTVASATRRPEVFATVAWLALDIAVAAAVIVVSTQAGADRSFFGGYPFSTVLVGALCLGLRGGLAAAVVLTAVSVGALGVGEAVASSLVYLAGAGVAAWGLDLIRRNDADRRGLERDLAAEQAERARSQERAETGAALHDSVLQTLALIQRRSGDPDAVSTLARRQERDLRGWLSGRGRLGGRTDRTFAEALSEAAAEVEADYPITVEVVTVGDAALDEALGALVAAAREAIVNAAKHAGIDSAAVFAEVAGTEATVYVRDRGRGFDPDNVEEDRRGIRESIVGRLQRHHGTASLHTAAGQGTEVQLRMPR